MLEKVSILKFRFQFQFPVLLFVNLILSHQFRDPLAWFSSSLIIVIITLFRVPYLSSILVGYHLLQKVSILKFQFQFRYQLLLFEFDFIFLMWIVISLRGICNFCFWNFITFIAIMDFFSPAWWNLLYGYFNHIFYSGILSYAWESFYFEILI